MAHLTVISGCMFAGKTRELIRRVNAHKVLRQSVHILKPAIDTRYSVSDVVSHDGTRLPAEVVPLDGSVWPTSFTDVIAIDEAQFFEPSIIPLIQESLARGVQVIASGLDLDSNGNPFGLMPTLLAMADEVVKFRATCSCCGATNASRTFRLVSGGPTVLVGGAEAYEPRCLACFKVL